MTDVNDIKAGDYELVCEQWDEVTSEPGKPFDFIRHRRGDVVKLDVEEARRLHRAGAVMKPGERQKAAAEAARVAYAAALALVPADLAKDLPDAPGVTPETSTAPGAPASSGDTGDTGAKQATIDEILGDVGADKAKAAAALETEKSYGDKARVTLVSKLEAVLAATGS